MANRGCCRINNVYFSINFESSLNVQRIHFNGLYDKQSRTKNRSNENPNNSTTEQLQ